MVNKKIYVLHSGFFIITCFIIGTQSRLQYFTLKDYFSNIWLIFGPFAIKTKMTESDLIKKIFEQIYIMI